MDEVLIQLKKLDEQQDTIARTVVDHTEQLDRIALTVTDHTEQLDRITLTVVDHTERLDRIEENMATKLDISKIMNTLDTLVGLAQKKDQELTILGYNVKNVTDRVEVLERDVS